MTRPAPWPPREPLWWPIPWAVLGFAFGCVALAAVVFLAVRWVVG